MQLLSPDLHLFCPPVPWSPREKSIIFIALPIHPRTYPFDSLTHPATQPSPPVLSPTHGALGGCRTDPSSPRGLKRSVGTTGKYCHLLPSFFIFRSYFIFRSPSRQMANRFVVFPPINKAHPRRHTTSYTPPPRPQPPSQPPTDASPLPTHPRAHPSTHSATPAFFLRKPFTHRPGSTPPHNNPPSIQRPLLAISTNPLGPPSLSRGAATQPRSSIHVQNASTGQTRLTIPTSSPVTCLRPFPGSGIERGLYFLADGSWPALSEGPTIPPLGPQKLAIHLTVRENSLVLSSSTILQSYNSIILQFYNPQNPPFCPSPIRTHLHPSENRTFSKLWYPVSSFFCFSISSPVQSSPSGGPDLFVINVGVGGRGGGGGIRAHSRWTTESPPVDVWYTLGPKAVVSSAETHG